jgi:hypothetical protein
MPIMGIMWRKTDKHAYARLGSVDGVGDSGSRVLTAAIDFVEKPGRRLPIRALV